MYKMILSDLDETLIVHHHVPDFNIRAIEQARKQGLKFVPATGRSYNLIPEILEEIGTYDKENEYSICFNGGLIIENKDHKILYFQGLTFEQTKDIFNIGRNYDVCVLIFTLDCCYIFNADELEVQRKIDQKANYQVIDEYNMDFLKGHKIAKIIFERRNMDYLLSIQEDMKSYTDGHISTSFSSGRYLEFNALGVNKGTALKWLADYLNIKTEEVIAIGDNYNDIEMIKEAGLGICVSSALDNVKAISDDVTMLDYSEGAVKEVIEKYVLEG